jgi:hypothetical protein
MPCVNRSGIVSLVSLLTTSPPVWGKDKYCKPGETGSVAGHYRVLRKLLFALSSSECVRPLRPVCSQPTTNRPLGRGA